MEFLETLQNFNLIRQPIKKDENNNWLKKLNELKFCEVSQNPISNWTWKFQRPILKNKKVLFLKKKFFLAVPPRYIQKMALAVSIFQKVLILTMGKKVKLAKDDLAFLVEATKYTKSEIKEWYRSFRKECPAGVLRKADLHSMYLRYGNTGHSVLEQI